MPAPHITNYRMRGHQGLQPGEKLIPAQGRIVFDVQTFGFFQASDGRRRPNRMPGISIARPYRRFARGILFKHLGHLVGTIEPGKRADIIAVNGDPLSGVSILESKDVFRLIMKDGQVFKNELV